MIYILTYLFLIIMVKLFSDIFCWDFGELVMTFIIATLIPYIMFCILIYVKLEG